MKLDRLILPIFIIYIQFGFGQQIENQKQNNTGDIYWTEGSFNPATTQLEYPPLKLKNLNDSLRMFSKTRNILTNTQFKAPKFQVPVRQVSKKSNPDFYTISAYFDHNTQYPAQVLDYTCGELSYDLENGYNHSGTDFYAWPFPWQKMYNNEVEVVAAAEGILYYKQDGSFDQNCELNNDSWNGCAVLHPDGSTSWYIHLKKNSLTTKSVGEEISAGEYLGVVGSSGSSKSPHLHFEAFDLSGNYIDPFEGSCNPTIASSWWANQMPYKEKGLLRISTNNSLPILNDCPNAEIANESTTFKPADTVFLIVYPKNIDTGDVIHFNIRKPDNSIYLTWEWTSSWPFYAASWLYYYLILNNDNYGTWTYEVVYNNQTYTHSFIYEESQFVTDYLYNQVSLYPNPASLSFSINSEHNISEILVMDFTGNIHINISELPKPTYTVEINTTKLTAGIYFVKIHTDAGILTRKIIVSERRKNW